MTASSLWLLALGSASGRLPFWELGAWTEGPPVSRWWVRSSDKKCPSTHVFSGARLHNFVRSFQVGPAGCYEGLPWGPGSPLKVRNLKYRPVGLLLVRLASSQHNFSLNCVFFETPFAGKQRRQRKRRQQSKQQEGQGDFSRKRWKQKDFEKCLSKDQTFEQTNLLLAIFLSLKRCRLIFQTVIILLRLWVSSYGGWRYTSTSFFFSLYLLVRPFHLRSFYRSLNWRSSPIILEFYIQWILFTEYHSN